jgi:AhpD family alkylhydroperoxidase
VKDDRDAFSDRASRSFEIEETAIMKNELYSTNNLANIEKMSALAPDLMKAFWAFDKAAVAAGAISVKYKELIAVGVAVTTQCPYCIDIHTTNAKAAGATDAELVEASMVAASIRAGSAVTHATHALTKASELAADGQGG